MRLKLNPTLSYIIGYWMHSKTPKGIGIKGDDEKLMRFAKYLLENNIVEPGKLLYERGKIYFYNSKLRKFMKKVESEKTERYKWHNEFASAFLAGLFDSEGDIDNGAPYLNRWDERDEIILTRLGFKTTKKRKKLFILPTKAFIKFISQFSQRIGGEIDKGEEKQ